MVKKRKFIKENQKKMKASELRIGNHIKLMLNDQDFVEVQVTANDIEAVNNKKGVYEPIPLKVEWLLKNGFSKENFDYIIPIGDCMLEWLGLMPHDQQCSAYSVYIMQGDEDEDDQVVFLSDISYVHQLQNLYFAITGNEFKNE